MGTHQVHESSSNAPVTHHTRQPVVHLATTIFQMRRGSVIMIVAVTCYHLKGFFSVFSLPGLSVRLIVVCTSPCASSPSCCSWSPPRWKCFPIDSTLIPWESKLIHGAISIHLPLPSICRKVRCEPSVYCIFIRGLVLWWVTEVTGVARDAFRWAPETFSLWCGELANRDPHTLMEARQWSIVFHCRWWRVKWRCWIFILGTRVGQPKSSETLIKKTKNSQRVLRIKLGSSRRMPPTHANQLQRKEENSKC